MTRSRGLADTSPRSSAQALWLLREPRLRVLLTAMVVACLLHGMILASGLAPMVPWLFRGQAEAPPLDEEVVLPIELDGWLTDGEQGAQARSAPSAGAEPLRGVPADDWGQVDAGLDDDEPSVDDFFDDEPVMDAGAGPQDGGKPVDAAAEEAGLSDPYAEWDDDGATAVSGDAGSDAAPGAEQPDGGLADDQADAGRAAPPPLEDPTVLAKGGRASFAPKHPNVEIYFATDKIREHALGAELSQMLLAFPEWQFVMGGTELDPVQDFDHILLAGPQMRRPEYVTAVVHYNAPLGRVRRAVDRARRQSQPPGKWLKGYPFAVTTVSNGHHVAALLPAKRLVVIHPAKEKDQIPLFKDIKPFQKSTEVVIGLKIAMPWRAFIGVPGVQLPKSLRWMRLTLTPVPRGDQPAGGGYIIRAEAEDESAEAAREHAAEIAQMLEVFRVPVEVPDWLPFAGRLLGGKRLELIGKPSFEVVDQRITVRAHASPKQIRFIVRWVKRQKEELSREIEAKRARKKRRTEAANRRPGSGKDAGVSKRKGAVRRAHRRRLVPPERPDAAATRGQDRAPDGGR